MGDYDQKGNVGGIVVHEDSLCLIIIRTDDESVVPEARRDLSLSGSVGRSTQSVGVQDYSTSCLNQGGGGGGGVGLWLAIAKAYYLRAQRDSKWRSCDQIYSKFVEHNTYIYEDIHSARAAMEGFDENEIFSI